MVDSRKNSSFVFTRGGTFNCIWTSSFMKIRHSMDLIKNWPKVETE